MGPREPERGDHREPQIGVRDEPSRERLLQDRQPTQDRVWQGEQILGRDVQGRPQREDGADDHEAHQRPCPPAAAFGDREPDDHREQPNAQERGGAGRVVRVAAREGVSLGELVRKACEELYGPVGGAGRLEAAARIRSLSLPVSSVAGMKAESVAAPKRLPR